MIKINAVRFYERQSQLSNDQDNIEFETIFNDPVVTEDENMINFEELKLYTKQDQKGAQKDENSSKDDDNQSFDEIDQSINKNHSSKNLITLEYTPQSETPASEMHENAFISTNNPHFKNISTSLNVTVRRSDRTKEFSKGYYKQLNEGTLKGKMAQMNVTKRIIQSH